jgi:hypothetical protein
VRVREEFWPAEAVGGAGGCQVRLEREEPVEPVGAQRPDGIPKLAVTLTGGHDLAGRKHRVLDLEVFQVGAQHGIAVGVRPHAALDEVRRVPDELELRRPDRLVPVDVLFVLVDEQGLLPLGARGKRRHPPEHFVAVPGRVVTLGDQEGEDTDIRCPQDLRGVQGPIQPPRVPVEVVGHRHLADGRRHRRRADAVPLEGPPQLLQLMVVEVEDVLVPGTPELDIADAEVGQQLALELRVGRDLVGEARNRPHQRPLNPLQAARWLDGLQAEGSRGADGLQAVAQICQTVD